MYFITQKGNAKIWRINHIHQKWETYFPPCVTRIMKDPPLMADSRFARSTSRPGEENDRSGWWVDRREIDAGKNSKKKNRWEWHVRTCYDCCLDRAGLIMDGLHSAAETTEARLPLLPHIRDSYILLLLEAAPRLRLATQMSFLTWEVNSSFSRGLLAGPFYWLGISRAHPLGSTLTLAVNMREGPACS